MSNISNTTLGDLVEFQRGYDLPKSQFIEGNVPVISSNGVLGYHNVPKVKAPGITIGRSGTVGLPHFINKDFFPHNTALFIKDFKGNYPRYIYYLIKTLGLNDYKSGSGVPTMNRNHLHPIKVRAFLDLEEQHKIAKVLSDLDTKIEINNRINSELEAMAKTLYDYWFVQFDFPYSPPSEGCPQDGVVFGKPYKSSGGKMVWNAELKREIPEGWEVNELSKVLTIKYGKDHKKLNEGAIPVYGSGGIMRYADKALYNDEAILIPRKGSIGNLFYIAEPFWSVDTMFYTIATAKDSTLYYFYQLSKLNLKTLNVGTAVPSLTTEVLNQIKLLIPDSEVMLKFNSIVSKNKSQILLNLKENQELAALRDWLLPMLMNGQVSVSDVEEELGMVAEPREIYKN